MKIIYSLIVVFALTCSAFGQQVFKAKLSQSGTSAPTADIKDNTCGTPTLERIKAGVYRLSIVSVFSNEAAIMGFGRYVLDSSTGTTIDYVRVVWDDESTSALIISTFRVAMDTGQTQYVDGLLNRTDIDIAVY